jgi:hypothetical protein
VWHRQWVQLGCLLGWLPFCFARTQVSVMTVTHLHHY